MRKVYVLKIKSRKQEDKCCKSCQHCKGICFRNKILRVCEVSNHAVIGHKEVCLHYSKRIISNSCKQPVKVERFRMKDYIDAVKAIQSSNANINFSCYSDVYQFVQGMSNGLRHLGVSLDFNDMWKIASRLMIAYRVITE